MFGANYFGEPTFGRGYAGVVNTNLTISVTHTQTPTIRRGIAKTSSVTNTQTPTIVRGVAKTLTATETQTPSVTRGVAKFLSVTHTQTPTIARGIDLTIAVVQSQVVSLLAVFGSGGGVIGAGIRKILVTFHNDQRASLESEQRATFHNDQRVSLGGTDADA